MRVVKQQKELHWLYKNGTGLQRARARIVYDMIDTMKKSRPDTLVTYPISAPGLQYMGNVRWLVRVLRNLGYVAWCDWDAGYIAMEL